MSLNGAFKRDVEVAFFALVTEILYTACD